LNYINGKLSVLFNLVLQGDDKALRKPLAVEKFSYFMVLFLVQRLPNALKALPADVSILEISMIPNMSVLHYQ
jgi:hypothetical protein